MKIELMRYENDDKEIACELIKNFWKEHNGIEIDAESFLEEWISEGIFYLIECDEKKSGFVCLGERGGDINWLEYLFIIPSLQNKGIGKKVLKLLEEIVSEYSDSLYLEVAARNLKALKLYKETGYNSLNTITLRKDFNEEDFDVISREKISSYEFEIRRKKF